MQLSTANPARRAVARCAVAFGLACMPAAFWPAAAADDLCGVTIVASVKLDHDLICAGDGLTVGADGVRLNLKGHTIAGSGGGAGVTVAGHTDVSILGGTVRNFATGVRVTQSADVVIKEMELRANGDGVDLQVGSTEITIKENAFRDNTTRGIMLRGGVVDGEIKDNAFTGNRVGILLFAPVDTVVKDNVISSSTLAGIRVNVLATRNLIQENTVSENPAGIEFLMTPTGWATGNTLQENTIKMNTCGLKGPTDGNTIQENRFEGNVADTCS